MFFLIPCGTLGGGHSAAQTAFRPKAPAIMGKWTCTVCGWEYDPAIGDPDGGIPPGTPFEAIADDWRCPECGAGKDQFEFVEA